MSSLTLTGFMELQRRLRNIPSDMRKRAESALAIEAETVRARAYDLCPKDTGALANSIRIDHSSIVQGRDSIGQFTSAADTSISIVVGGPDAPHAIAVHEYPSEHNPPTWNGVTVTFDNGEPKFLEKALFERAKGLARRVGLAMMKG